MSYKIILQTQCPVAFDSPDHLEPEGVMNDNSTSLPLIREVEQDFFNVPLQVLDLGCAGGALVHDFIKRGHIAVGLEGSDFNLITRRAEWEFLADKNLFSCDITRDFTLSLEDEAGRRPYLCDLITSWEVMEHLAESRLSIFFENIRKHLKPNGKYVGGVCLAGGTHHQSVFSKEVWEQEILNKIPGLALKAYPYKNTGHDSASSYFFMLKNLA